MVASATQLLRGHRTIAGTHSDWKTPVPRKKAPYAHQSRQCDAV
jgi:hypothetical protein